ncbi:probable DNA polymerase II (DP2), subunit 1 [Thermoplasma acidophilum]|uniref:ORC1-type DNA replication protein 2 n=1 Tax=Thermoplasma acidophilum (strain ATCC 25905 / DSM 1728 / JCM 9062 / NBRC 15155 / AMRC-C165) TaxID=273075 RepID=CDC62_THEAC|nr:ORC1-type DNA replication protein [Thermoplasma acidophilum]Q9HKG3.1 RecName: Full=ORC1-type DNA replication protein 2 [Thermoplasma acidophilum DSM 1728]CAC11775.1 probable DNA polymerase II (DP2), subunit 1 [Thermoplasma acidophilum]
MDNPFARFAGTRTIQANLSLLEENYVPDSFPHRENQINEMVTILSSIMRGSRPSNIIVYGKTGTGKTSTTKYVTKMLVEAASNVSVVYVNCEIYDSPYSILVAIANSAGEEKIPELGWPIDRIYRETVERVEKTGKFFIIILDEMDRLIKKNGGDSLYVLLKLMTDVDSVRVSMIGITNDTTVLENIDARIKSRLNQESIVFPPYNASEIRDIISSRLDKVLGPGVVDDTAINLCAAIGAQEHGDARKAIDLMRIAIEIAIRENRNKITENEIYEARERYEMNVLREAISTLPLHSKIVLLSAVVTQEIEPNSVITGEIYENYRRICDDLGFSPLSPRRISDLLTELADYGLLVMDDRNMGKYGRTRSFSVVHQAETIKKYLLEDENLSMFKSSKMPKQTRFDT